MKLSEGERILYALTAVGSLSFAQLSRLLSSVRNKERDEDSLNLERWITVTTLSALGHCEWISKDGSETIYSTRSVLARLPVTGLPTAVLTGGRQPETIADLRKACRGGSSYTEIVEDVLEDWPAISPNRILVQSDSLEGIDFVANELGIPFLMTPPAWCLAAAAPKLDSVVATMTWSPRPLMDWKHRYFHPADLRFALAPISNDTMNLVRYIHPHSQQAHFELRRGDEATFVDPEWGRYVVLDSVRKRVLRYDSLRHQFAVPTGARLPRMLARALCLCSGRPPLQVMVGDRRHEVFSSVPPTIAHLVGKCVNQEIQIQTIPF